MRLEWSIDEALRLLSEGKHLREIGQQFLRTHQAIQQRIRYHVPGRYRTALRAGCLSRIDQALKLPLDLAWFKLKRQQALAYRVAPDLLRGPEMRAAVMTLYSRTCDENAKLGKRPPRKPRILVVHSTNSDDN